MKKLDVVLLSFEFILAICLLIIISFIHGDFITVSIYVIPIFLFISSTVVLLQKRKLNTPALVTVLIYFVYLLLSLVFKLL